MWGGKDFKVEYLCVSLTKRFSKETMIHHGRFSDGHYLDKRVPRDVGESLSLAHQNMLVNGVWGILPLFYMLIYSVNQNLWKGNGSHCIFCFLSCHSIHWQVIMRVYEPKSLQNLFPRIANGSQQQVHEHMTPRILFPKRLGTLHILLKHMHK